MQYGHKLTLITGKSGLILDLVIEPGNPADAERFVPMLDRHISRCGTPPRQMAADGSYASRDNLNQAKARGVSDVAFPKKRGLAVADHGQEPVGVPQAAPLPRRYRGRHFLLQARLWRGTLHLARARPLQSLGLVGGGGAQPGAVRPPQTGIAPHPLPQHGDGDDRNPARFLVHVRRVRYLGLLPCREILLLPHPRNSASGFHRIEQHAFMDAH